MSTGLDAPVVCGSAGGVLLFVLATCCLLSGQGLQIGSNAWLSYWSDHAIKPREGRWLAQSFRIGASQISKMWGSLFMSCPDRPGVVCAVLLCLRGVGAGDPAGLLAGWSAGRKGVS